MESALASNSPRNELIDFQMQNSELVGFARTIGFDNGLIEQALTKLVLKCVSLSLFFTPNRFISYKNLS